MTTGKLYDVAIVGGGLAGLALSIQLGRQGYSVILFEKEQYPFHKVCGEYISLESWDFLHELGIDLTALQVPIIKKIKISAANGKTIEQILPLGGFGISRFTLDKMLAELARDTGVEIKENTRVNDISFGGDEFSIYTVEYFRSKIACGSFGKRSNLDIKWKRHFTTRNKSKLNNYIGVKYHTRGNFPADIIQLHYFKNGYCGLVKIENDQYNVCYLTTAANLQKAGGNIQQMEKDILSQNPHLAGIFDSIDIIPETQQVISQISFDRKMQVENHILFIGDAAGMITPLCGNGMSMALHGSKIAALLIHKFLQGHLSREKMEQRYCKQWQHQFASRLKTGRRIQRFFGRNWAGNLVIAFMQKFPALLNTLIRKTHGKPF